MGKKSSDTKPPALTESPEPPVRQLCEFADAILDLADLIERCGINAPLREIAYARQKDVGQLERFFFVFPDEPPGKPIKVRNPATNDVYTFRPQNGFVKARWPLTDEECRLRCVLWTVNGALRAIDDGNADPESMPDYLRSLAGEVRPKRKPLSPNAAAVYEVLLALEPHQALTGEQILERLSANLDLSTLSRRHLPELFPYGLTNHPRIGYSILPRHRPA